MDRTPTLWALVVIFLSGLLLFARLGHAALWDDEANTALAAEGVWQTGDTSAVLGHNIVANRGGVEISNLRFRYMPPLPAYWAAPWIGPRGATPFWARLPFAVVGFGGLILFAAWMLRHQTTSAERWIAACAILGNVSLFLYLRQCRYYALALTASLVLAYFYFQPAHRARRWGILAASLVLFASHYVNFAALWACLLLDYALWGRSRQPLSARDWLTIVLPQVVINGVILWIWNPLGRQHLGEREFSWLREKALLFLLNLRDLNLCEFGVGLLLLLAIPLSFRPQNIWLRRGLVALGLYVAIVSFASPQLVRSETRFADVRYLAPLIPLTIFLSVATCKILVDSSLLAWPAAVLLFGTNLFHLPFLFGDPVQSTIVSYVRELAEPPEDSYRATAAWIKNHVAERDSVLVFPDYAAYPLMFLAPEPTYAWQVRSPEDPQFRDLAAIHFFGQVPPEYVIVFGPGHLAEIKEVGRLTGKSYARTAVIDCHYYAGMRPELYWHTFWTRTHYDPETEAVYIYRREK